MSKFKVGDRVRTIKIEGDHSNYPELSIGDIGEIIEVDNSDYPYYVFFEKAKKSTWCYERELTLINYKTFMSSIIEKAKLAFKKEPQKSFQKAGITDSSDNLTTEGTQVFLNYLLQKHGAEFKTEVVDPILAEEKA